MTPSQLKTKPHIIALLFLKIVLHKSSWTLVSQTLFHTARLLLAPSCFTACCLSSSCCSALQSFPPWPTTHAPRLLFPFPFHSVRPSSFLSRSLLRFLRTRASSSYMYCAQAPPPPAEHAPIRPFCLVPAAAAASSAAVSHGHGDGAARTVVVEPKMGTGGILPVQMIVLPTQARDKHVQSTPKKSTVFLQTLDEVR
eukprot:COSAG06_NODE_608_length_13862_cov_86.760355_6_plen_197_part_00